MTLTAATQEEIVDAFMCIPSESLRLHNWAIGEHWNVTDGTYINGVILTVDQDVCMGYLIEAIDRETGNIMYAAIVDFDGHGVQNCFRFMETPGGESCFDERFIGQEEAALWGIRAIFGIMESYEDELESIRSDGCSTCSGDRFIGDGPWCLRRPCPDCTPEKVEASNG